MLIRGKREKLTQEFNVLYTKYRKKAEDKFKAYKERRKNLSYLQENLSKHTK